MDRLNSIADGITEVLVLKLVGSKKTTAAEVRLGEWIEGHTSTDKIAATIGTISEDIAKSLAASLLEAPSPDDDETMSGVFEAIAWGPSPEEMAEKHHRRIKSILFKPLSTLNRLFLASPQSFARGERLVRLFYEQLLKHPKFGEMATPAFRAAVTERLTAIV